METALELFDFLEDPKQDVRLLAIQHLAGCSLHEEFVHAVIKQKDLLQKVLPLLDKSPVLAEHAWKLLINMSQDKAIAAYLQSLVHLEESIFAIIKNRSSPFGDLACMLLSNLSKVEDFQKKLIPRTNEIVAVYLAIPSNESLCNYEFLASVIADLTNLQEGRQYFIEHQEKLHHMMECFLTSPSVIRRGGIVTIIKNCLFEVNFHTVILKDYDDKLLSSLLGRLCNSKSTFSEDEQNEMLIEISLELRHTEEETDVTIRRMIVEALLVMACTSLQGRKLLREKKSYPIIREWHKQESDEDLDELLYKLVDLLLRDDEEEEKEGGKASENA